MEKLPDHRSTLHKAAWRTVFELSPLYWYHLGSFSMFYIPVSAAVPFISPRRHLVNSSKPTEFVIAPSTPGSTGPLLTSMYQHAPASIARINSLSEGRRRTINRTSPYRFIVPNSLTAESHRSPTAESLRSPTSSQGLCNRNRTD